MKYLRVTVRFADNPEANYSEVLPVSELAEKYPEASSIFCNPEFVSMRYTLDLMIVDIRED